ncbi:2-acylglycerol O-acyltransferase 1 [Orchesella cincta]|uniref:Acyltransferase n=1 Tax=Orchesella cincta TaxID=48709 RepID=A0A1D2MA32_ORCCI|nr:2-acylglycerol O-acyltransferase 1 [Orchesella cincta]
MGKKREDVPKKVLGVEFAPVHLPWERRMQTLSVMVWFFLFFVVPLASYPTMIYLMFFSSYQKQALSVLLPYLFWIWAVDRDSCNKGARRFKWVRGWTIWKRYVDYFPIKLVKTADLDPKRNYLFGSHPHGVLCSGAFGAFATDALEINKHFPGFNFSVLTLDINYRFPILRDLILSLGVCAATRNGMNYLLGSKGGGRAAVLIPGGAPESLDSHPGSYVVQLKHRKGFIKVALQNGSPLVPCFSFGETDIFDQPANPKGSLLRTVQDRIQKTLQLAPVPFSGRGIFQYSFGVLPNRRPITVVVGAPIELEKTAQPTQKEIDDLHQKYVDAVVELFYKHKDKYVLDPNHVITIV